MVSIFEAIWVWVASAILSNSLAMWHVIGAIILFAVAVGWRVFRAPGSPFFDSLRAVFNDLWRLLRAVVRLYRYCCTSIVSLIPNTISLLCQSLSAGSLSAGFLVITVVAVAALVGYLGSLLAFPAPTRSLPAARTRQHSAIRNPRPRLPRSASGSTPALRFLRNMPRRWRIAGIVIVGAVGVAARSAGVGPDEVSPLDFFVAQVHRIPRNVFVATGAILLGAIPYEDVWNYVSDTGNRYETMVRRVRRNISPGSRP